MGIFEPHHLILILLVALLLFGPGKIGELGGQLGKSIRDFKKAMAEPDPAPTVTATQPAASMGAAAPPTVVAEAKAQDKAATPS